MVYVREFIGNCNSVFLVCFVLVFRKRVDLIKQILVFLNRKILLWQFYIAINVNNLKKGKFVCMWFFLYEVNLF